MKTNKFFKIHAVAPFLPLKVDCKPYSISSKHFPRKSLPDHSLISVRILRWSVTSTGSQRD